jgi:hypothetical protein
VKVYEPRAGRQRWIGTFETEAEAIEAERSATLGVAPSARARSIRDWSLVWLRDYPRNAPATRRNYAYAVKRINEDARDLLLARIDRPTARRLAKKWPVNVVHIARTIFADAQRDGVVETNPFSNLRLATYRGRCLDRDRDRGTSPGRSPRAQ